MPSLIIVHAHRPVRFRWQIIAMCLLILLIGSGVSSRLDAQQTTIAETVGKQTPYLPPPDTATSSEDVPVVPRWATPAQVAVGVGFYANRLSSAVPSERILASRDTIRTAVAERTQAWLTQLGRASVRGIQLDAMGRLFVAAGDDAQAVAQFEQRLATPGLSLVDRAYTYQLATFAFYDPDKSERRSIATRYFEQLMALPTNVVGYWQFQTLAGFARMYDLRGESREVISYTARAFALTPHMPFLDRKVVFNGPYVMYADALAGTSTGRATLDTLNARLLALTIPPADLIANDSAYVWVGEDWARRFRYDIAMTEHLGQPAAPIMAHRWFNATRPGPTDTGWTPISMPLNDGKIRLIEFGDRYCTFCMRALPAMDRLHRALVNRGVEVWYVTNTFGIWNTTFIDRDEEIDRLKDLYLHEKKMTLPIAVWAGENEVTEDDGILPAPSPNVDAYQVVSRPVFYLIDGKGFIRHISRGFSPADEPRLRARVERLLNESAARHDQR